MKVENRQMLNKAVNILKRLGISKDDITITGSLALDLVGVLPENREVHDADFLISVDKETWERLKFLESATHTSNQIYPDNFEQAMFKLDGIYINVWYSEKRIVGIKDFMTGAWVKEVKDILEMKKKYGRKKDFADLCGIAEMILNTKPNDLQV